MRVGRHFRTGEPIRLADGRMGMIKAHAVMPVDLLVILLDDGTRRDIPAETVTWRPAERCWVEGA